MKPLRLVLAACVAGCASAEAPGNDLAADKTPSARLEIEHIARGAAPAVKVSLARRPLEHCRAADAVSLATLGDDALGRTSREARIPAEAPVTLLVASATPAVKCDFRVRFAPEAGARYRLVYRTVQGGCVLSLERRDGGSWKTEPYDDPNPECLPKPSRSK